MPSAEQLLATPERLNRLRALEDLTRLIPAHFEALCRQALRNAYRSGGDVRSFNIYLRAPNRIGVIVERADSSAYFSGGKTKQAAPGARIQEVSADSEETPSTLTRESVASLTEASFTVPRKLVQFLPKANLSSFSIVRATFYDDSLSRRHV